MAGRKGGLPAIAKSIESRWRAVLRVVAGWDRAAIVMPGETLPDGAILPWCDLFEIGPTPAAIVARANDKRTSHAIEVELGLALPGARLVDSIDAFEQAARDVSGRWVVKDPWGVAGRERALGDGSPTTKEKNWCLGRLSQGLDLVFEPWVEDRREWSIHFDANAAEVAFVGSCALLTHRDGTFRGIRVGDEAPGSLVEGAKRAAAKIAEMGYRGPIGIDAMTGVVAGRETVRPVTEINARYSFGRLALELADRTDVAEFEWRHDAPADDVAAGWDELESGRPCRLPDFCDPEGRSGSWCRVWSG